METITCVELISQLTDFLEGATGPDLSARIHQHLGGCPSCDRHTRQVELARRVMAAIPAERLSRQLEVRLLALHRGHVTSAAGEQ